MAKKSSKKEPKPVSRRKQITKKVEPKSAPQKQLKLKPPRATGKPSRPSSPPPPPVEEPESDPDIEATPVEDIPVEDMPPEEREEILHPEKTADRLLQEERKIDCPAPAPSPFVAAMQTKPSSSLASHVIVRARAGTGKTTTMIAGLNVLKGCPPLTASGSPLTPSPQQKVIWDALLEGTPPRFIGFVAFNRSIANELKQRVPLGVDAKTCHGLGYKAVIKAFPHLAGDGKVHAGAVQEIICDLLGMDIWEARKRRPTTLAATAKLVSLVKQNLILDLDVDKLEDLADFYEIDLNGSRQEVFDLVPKVIEMSKEPGERITFDDQIWLPVVLDLPVFRYDLLLVDEAQDLNRCQQALVKKAGKRLVFIGDDRQAIYGFAGADSESLPRLQEELEQTPAGCKVLPLTVTRRCGKKIVEEAREIVEDFEAHETNPEGVISSFSRKVYMSQVKAGDFILCRVNAPLVSECLKFIKEGRKASILGRDSVGASLIALLDKLGKDLAPDEVPLLIQRIEEWGEDQAKKENAKKFPSEARLISIQDKVECLLCFVEGAKEIEDAKKKIDAIFTDSESSPGIRLSSIHKSKGLESERVFFLQPKGAGCPHPMAKSGWQVLQEWNLKYVAVTRAIQELIYVFE